MLRTRENYEASELTSLAPYAQKSALSEGRKYPETSHAFRTEFQRDRARIIHSRSFRRLEYKTQVFLNGTGDHLRTRLTHTIEVASISRTISRALCLNEDLAEAIAMAHDLGHAPFGHSGEEMLDELMHEHGGFEHNSQSLRVVELLENKYPKFPGLNLSSEVLQGLRKHEAFQPDSKPSSSPCLEAQITNIADEITYYSHDLDDGMDFELLAVDQLEKLTLWSETSAAVQEDYKKLKGPEFRTFVIRCLIDRLVEDVIVTSAKNIEKAGLKSIADVSKQKKPLVSYSPAMTKATAQLRKFLYQNLYYHPKVADVNKRACTMLRNVFNAYVSCPSLLGKSAAQRVRKEGLHRTICDYLSGMTDRYLMEEHQKLFLQEGMLRALRGGREVHSSRLTE
ncbi:MAG TPA: deoxyguanosinetriphosphate triphosphohydrolase [Chthoniobacterales bacterium]|jgi:dGTPase